MGKVRFHRNCGGAIKNNQCTKCGKKFGVVKRFFAQYYDEAPEEEKDKNEGFNPNKYRKRIRKGEDIFKGDSK